MCNKIHRLRQQQQEQQQQEQQQNEEETIPQEIRRARRARYSKLNLNLLSDGTCIYLFHFALSEIERITTALRLGHVYHFSSIQVRKNLDFAMLLNWYSFLKHLGDMSILFGMSESNVSVVCQEFESIVMNQIKWGLQFNIK
ncbi:hypothetical protein PHYBLDRAFT_64905 [Phycomyces blakesleeanus NRRL 1555(-)]|uniref:Uncharacterized protein n=1 Tax=Phycomyces blakesleeanus (strain ATCC 8743b / DSM 1359 / FGSC 10004 / NBRC 33097 / NRRL 1555) TaxID=763407 RepID=A0A163AJR9_PHYB8|nr:hypothetical protein PHYBLDRAFT_64905 [Phycomyces blakesleeanus NRRL 1555(-)]OAD73951.1 hypothetical protein PHYBLDRAFT_64905 [Phycomyces blakesleeanus NRRL 1555(-)]|eukprot:XP_018291991.1 hypothetical protein PHYBLDRAFT_64905 [Phycomyces blakesleeanus NRRL 1555(-)]